MSLVRYGESISGPEYASRLLKEIGKRGIECRTGSSVIDIGRDRVLTVASARGTEIIKAGAIIATAGCRERSRGAIMIPGERPAGVYTAGTAQAYMNLYNRMPGRKAVILGSGDIGLIMARRLTLEGAEVSAVFELQDHPNGLERNIVQCLDDYSIPLYLNHTVTEIHGKERIEGVTVSEVDRITHKPKAGTEKYYPCDTLILSVGLRPDNGLLKDAGIAIDPRTDGAIVDEHLMTSIPGVFSSGNVLHVHDLADFVSLESEHLAASVAAYLSGGLGSGMDVSVRCGSGVGHTVPQKVVSDDGFTLSLRVRSVMRDAVISVSQGGRRIVEKKMRKANPAEMIMIDIPGGSVCPDGDLEVVAG